jgi:protein-arginine kinase activator protein McsA
MATATAPLQTVTQARRVHGKSYVLLSCGHCTLSSKELAVGDRFQCRAVECRDAARQAAMDAMNLASVISGKLQMRFSESADARRHLAPTAELQALATELQETLAHLASTEAR